MCGKQHFKMKILGLMFVSDQDWMKRIEFTFSSETDKIHTKYINNSFQDTKHQKIKDSDSWDIRNKWDETHKCPSLMPWRVSRSRHKEEELRQSPEHIMSWGDEPESLVRSKCLAFSGQSTRQARSAQRKQYKNLQSGPLSS